LEHLFESKSFSSFVSSSFARRASNFRAENGTLEESTITSELIWSWEFNVGRGERPIIAQEMEKLGGTSEEDEEEEMDMEVKDEDDEDEDDDEEKKNRRAAAAAAAAAAAMMAGNEAIGSNSNNRFQHLHHHHHHLQQQHQQYQEQMTPTGGGGGGEGSRRCRPKEEKERTKLRERHRRAITARILAGLRRHGNYNLRVRADINDVIAALAREAGWVVLPDGTTFPSRSQSGRPVGATSGEVVTSSSQMLAAQNPTAALRVVSPVVRNTTTADYHANRMKNVFVPSSLSYDGSSSARSRSRIGSFVEERGEGTENSPLMGSCIDGADDKQVIDIPPKLQERDFAGTPCVPVYVMLPLGVINMKCELVDPDGLYKQLRILKSINVDGVMVDCWWGIVEAHAPQEYNWSGYKRLFQIVRELKLKLQVVMSFHECGGNVGDDVHIPLPLWVAEIGRNNPDIYFTDREGRRNPECLTWGIDKERALRGRNAVEVYYEFMRSFRLEFEEFIEDDIISEIEVGLGPCGELHYPSYPVKHGWRYPGIGEFQCYDKYLLKSLRKAAEARGHVVWARGPGNAGSYISQPHETGFFCDGGEYDGYYGRFFLNWYSQVLIDHADLVLTFAKMVFEDTPIAVKVSGIHWWYKTASHAAELAAGFYNFANRDGYAPIAAMLKKHEVALNFTCVELRTLDQHEDFPEALADPEGLVWQVLNAAWDACIPVASENALPCHDRDGYNKILESAKPMNNPDGKHLSSFTYLRLSQHLMERENLLEFQRFVKRMHGETVLAV
ncbi:beta-amylase 2, chloroplastic-like, partial [Macadamia integrifolia]|uniref:beta-amylase 2, chloroplastic-like n=1 Tax=Macadamia integrifolia TaxID=60698 RepID=UPI001C4F310E